MAWGGVGRGASRESRAQAPGGSVGWSQHPGEGAMQEDRLDLG